MGSAGKTGDPDPDTGIGELGGKGGAGGQTTDDHGYGRGGTG